jgi:hypothetical protein
LANHWGLGRPIGSCIVVGALAIATLLCSVGGPIEHRPFSVSEILRAEVFKPSFPPERELIERYGRGAIERIDNELFHVYRDGKHDLWIGCRVEEEDRVYRPITGIVLSRRPLSSAAKTPGMTVSYSSLEGLRVGDSLKKMYQKLGKPLRSYLKPLGKGADVLTYEYAPKHLEQGSCLRFYAQNDTVVAMSFSSEE